MNQKIKILLKIIMPHLPMLIMMQVFYFVWALDNTLQPYLFSKFITSLEQYYKFGQAGELWKYAGYSFLSFILLCTLINAMYHVNDFMIVKVAPLIQNHIKKQAFIYINRQKYISSISGMIGSSTNMIDNLVSSAWAVYIMAAQTMIPSILGVIIAIVMFAMVNTIFACIIVLWVIIHGACCYYYSKLCHSSSIIYSKHRNIVAGKIGDAIINHNAIRLFNRSNYEEYYVNKFLTREKKAYTKHMLLLAKMKLVLGFFYSLFLLCILVPLQLWLFNKNLISIGDIVYVTSAANNIATMIWLLSLMLSDFFTQLGILFQSCEILDDEKIENYENSPPIIINKGEIVFENVSFSHYSNKRNLYEYNFTIKPGEKIGLAGFAGCGKSTLVGMILRYFNLNSGRILIDGQDIAQCNLKSLRDNIITIPQEPILFNRSIIDNLRYGNLDASMEDIERACEQAGCLNFIKRMRNGYNSVVGERGNALSVGQRQQIVIARAFLKKAKIIIIDEATASIDAVTEEIIQNSLNKIMKDKTAIIIAHRMITLKEVDNIIVIENGCIAERGSHTELLAKGGSYAKMWGLQSNNL